MKWPRRLLWMCLLLSTFAWAQSDRSDAPHSRKASQTVVHKMPAHAARQLSLREQHERAQMRAEQRRQAKLAKKQRKEAMKRSHHLHKVQAKTSSNN